MERFKSVVERINFSSMTPKELENLGRNIVEIYLRHLTMIKYSTSKSMLKKYDIGLKATYTLSEYCSVLVRGIRNQKNNNEVMEYQRKLEDCVDYITHLDYETKSDNSVGKNFKNSIKSELTKVMVTIENRDKNR